MLRAGALVQITYQVNERDMTDKYTGRCAQRKWRWKPTRSSRYPNLRIGETFAFVETRCAEGFSGEPSMPEGVTVSMSPTRFEFRTKFSESRTVCIERYTSLKAHIESCYPEADKAVIASKKSSRQIQTLKSGSK